MIVATVREFAVFDMMTRGTIAPFTPTRCVCTSFPACSLIVQFLEASTITVAEFDTIGAAVAVAVITKNTVVSPSTPRTVYVVFQADSVAHPNITESPFLNG